MKSVGKGMSYLGDTIEVMNDLIKQKIKVDFVLTSPPYNMRNHEKTFYNEAKTFRDNMDNQEYKVWLINNFQLYDKLLRENGVVLFNLNYMSSRDNQAINIPYILVAIEEQTNFTLIDHICWKKRNAMPLTEARLSRVWESVYIFIKKNNWNNFNKQYKNVLVGKYNFIEAPNNDETNAFNKACFSTSLVEQLLTLYGVKKHHIVLDNFMGTHTTAVACEKLGVKWLGIEIDKDTRQYGLDRVYGFIGDYKNITNIDKPNQLNLFDIYAKENDND